MARTAFLFPGQGAQTVGMGAGLAADFAPARELFDQASKHLGYDLLTLCAEGPADQLDSTESSQPAIFVASLAALEKLKHESPGVVADCVATAGLSLGEYTALVFAEVMSFADGLKVVAERGSAMQDAAEAVPSGMLSILGLEVTAVESLCAEAAQGDVLQVANHLCPGNVVVSGCTAACERVADLADKAGAMKVVPLAVAGAFHTSIMQPAVDRLTAVLSQIELKPPRIPVISNVDATAHDDPETIRQLLVRQLVSPVRWEDSMRNLLGNTHSIEQCYEIGPGRVLRGLLKRIDRKFPCEGVEA